MVSFSSIIQGDAFKLSLVFFVVGALIMILMTKLRKQFSQNKKSVIIYLIVVLITFALVGLLSSKKVLNDTPLNSYFGFQALFLLLGIGHIYVLKNYFQGISQNKSGFFTEFLFTVVVACIGLIAFFNVVNIFKAPFKFIFLASATAFIAPLLFYKLYVFATLIPVPVYKKWVYPFGENIKDPTAKELKDPLVISFEFRKKEHLSDVTNFRVKAPEAMEFGKLFYFFINDYNERHPESKIEFLDATNQEAQGWIFYFKPNWWSSIKHINFLKTISGNNIKEDNVIICQRVEI